MLLHIIRSCRRECRRSSSYIALAIVPVAITTFMRKSNCESYSPPLFEIEDSTFHLPVVISNVSQPKYLGLIYKFSQQAYETFANMKEFILDVYHITTRLGFLAFLFVPVIASSPVLATIFESPAYRNWWWDLLRNKIRQSGPCISKLAQWIATRPDLFPIYICNELQLLQNVGYIHHIKYTKSELSKMFTDDELNHIQILNISGSGCVAQVYEAIYNNNKIAIKVLHPYIKDIIDSDLKILKFIIRTLENIPGIKYLSLFESIEQFQELLLEQLNLSEEAKNLIKFSSNFSSNKWKDSIRFPQPISPYISENLLIESYESGESIIEAIPHMNTHERSVIAKLGLDFFLKMIFEDNFIHADLHPGNILIHRNMKDIHKSTLILLDAGLVTKLAPIDRKNFIDLFYAVITNNGKKVANLLIERSKEQKCLNVNEFEDKIQAIVNDVYSNGLNLGRIGIDKILHRVFIACYLHQVKLDSHFASIIVSIGVLEGLGRRLDPNINILKEAIPFILKAYLHS
eukprot:gene5735-11597_t